MFRRLFRASPNKESIFADIRNLLASTLEIDRVYPQFAEIVNRILPFDQLVITDIDAERKVRISHFSGVEVKDENYGAPIDLKGTLTDQVIQSRSPYIYQRKYREQIAAEHPWLLPTADVGINSWLAVPLISQREVFGAIVVTSKVVDAFTKQAIDILVEVSAEIAPMFANSHLYMELVRRNATLEGLQRDSRAMLDFYPDGILVEVDSKIAYCNPAIIDLSGYAEEEILDKPPTEFIVPDDRKRADAVVRKLLAGTPGNAREYRVLKKDGTIMPTEISSRLITHAGKPALLSVIRDITDRKRAEEATQQSEELYRTLVDNSVLGLYTPGEPLIFSNQRLAEIVGYTKEECESPEFNFMCLFLAEDQKLIADDTRGRLAGKKYHHMRFASLPKTTRSNG